MKLLSSSCLPTSFSVGWLGFEDEDVDESENERWAEDQGRDPLFFQTHAFVHAQNGSGIFLNGFLFHKSPSLVWSSFMDRISCAKSASIVHSVSFRVSFFDLFLLASSSLEIRVQHDAVASLA